MKNELSDVLEKITDEGFAVLAAPGREEDREIHDELMKKFIKKNKDSAEIYVKDK
jgi:hypothetical protein